jgi:hypothetical protein
MGLPLLLSVANIVLMALVNYVAFEIIHLVHH